MLNLILEDIDSYFLFSHPEYPDSTQYNLSRFIQKNILLDHFDVGRDGVHHGPNSHLAFSEKMFNNFWPIIKQKLTLPK